MEISERKKKILAAVVDAYIHTAEPVGSKAIAQTANLGCSSATIRNELSELTALGYLEQPHTSAGRVPSDKAYRLYVNNMMQRSRLTEDEVKVMSAYCQNKVKGLDAVMRETANVLSSITRYTALVMMPESSTNRLRHLQLVPLAEGYALVVVVTDAGVARDSVIQVPADMGADELDRISRAISQRYYNCE